MYILLLRRGGYSGGDDTGHRFSFRVYDKENLVNLADGIVAIFKQTMRGIVEHDSVLVIEDQRGGLKAHAMLFQVQRGLVRVPLELHGQFPLVTL